MLLALIAKVRSGVLLQFRRQHNNVTQAQAAEWAGVSVEQWGRLVLDQA